METTLGCGYLFNDESILTDFYSPPSSIIDEGDNHIESSLKQEHKPIKLMSLETTPPLTPRHLLDNTIKDLQNMKINTNLPVTPSVTTPTNWPLNSSVFPSNTSNTMDQYFLEHPRVSDSMYKSATKLALPRQNGQHTEVTNETSRLLSYMNPIENSANGWSSLNSRYSIPSDSSSSFNRPGNSFFPNTNPSSSSLQNPWVLSEISTILRQNNNNNHHFALSATAQQILNGTNRPLRSEKIDIEVIKHLIQEAQWKRQCGMKKEICVFCRNNGENELIYSSHSLKDSLGNVTCPILRAYQCPICGATGSQAHTIKYCQSTNDDHNRQILTPYEKMLRMQTYGFDDNLSSSIPALLAQFSSPSSLYSNGWSDSYL